MPNMDHQAILETLRQTMQAEAKAVSAVASQLPQQVTAAVELLFECRGRVIVAGMGKMSAIARKCAATFCSTGTPAVFLHPAEALHGDLGIVSESDVLLVLSYSGETDEVLGLLPYMKRHKVPVIALTGKPSSPLGKEADVVFPITIDQEADPISVAPTSSTTVCLAACDALAMTLMNLRGFTREQFAIFHPGGQLGRKLLLSVSDVMKSGTDLPVVDSAATLRQAIVEMSSKSLGVILVIDQDHKLLGLLTDGDLRRCFEKNDNPLDRNISELMTTNPVTISEDMLAAESMQMMESKSITVLPVLNSQNQIAGVLHLHHLLQAGLA